MQVVGSLAGVNAEKQDLEERVARFWKERQEILLEAEVRVEVGGEGGVEVAKGGES